MLGLQGDTRVVLFLNISFWWQTFVFRCVPVGINKVVETERGDVRGIQGKGYQRGLLEGRRGHKQHVGEDGNQHSKGGLRGVWSNQRKWRRG